MKQYALILASLAWWAGCQQGGTGASGRVGMETDQGIYGSVDSQRYNLGAMVQQVPGVRDVNNQLQVSGTRTTSGFGSSRDSTGLRS